MARGPNYRLPFRRRRQGKTNYYRRLRLIKSRRTRLVIRASTKHTVVQLADAKKQGDIILARGHSKELGSKFGYKGNPGNVPAAYLTGLLAGLRAKQAGIEDAILDLGVFVRRVRVMAAFKGILDSGLDVHHGEGLFPEGLEAMASGTVIADYAKYFDKMVKEEQDARKKVAAAKKQAEADLAEEKITQEEFDAMDFSGPAQDHQALYKKQFSAYLQNKFDPHAMEDHVTAVKKKIQESVK